MEWLPEPLPEKFLGLAEFHVEEEYSRVMSP